MGTKEERNAQLDVLKEAFREHKDKKLDRLYKQRDFLKTVLDKRGVSHRVQDDVINKLTAVSETDLDRFLTG